MKKVRIIILFMTLFLGMLFLLPVKVFASDEQLTAKEWFNYISQFDVGFAKGEVDDFGDIFIVEEPSHEYDGCWIAYTSRNYEEDSPYFHPEITEDGDLAQYLRDDEGILGVLEYYEDFDGYFYWNFEEHYWQIEYYATSELDYYIQRIEELENEIQDLENEIGLLEDEIQDLENEISLLENEIQDLEDEKGLLENEIQDLENQIQDLENEIQQLEDEISLLQDENSSLNDEIQRLEDEKQQLEEALDFEYERGFDEGYQIGYNEGLLVENNDITKWFIPLVVIIIVVGIFESIKIFKRSEK